MTDLDASRFQALLDLYKQQMEHFHHTQDIEWRANFGVWTLLAAGIYMGPGRILATKNCCFLIVAGIVLAAAVVIHALWLSKVHSSEAVDKELWSHFRTEALAAIRGANGDKGVHSKSEFENKWLCTSSKRFEVWLLLEVAVTFSLCLVFFLSLYVERHR